MARYADGNPNGSLRDIAAIANEAGNVVGIMPHPEHAVEALTGPSLDGLGFFTSAAEVEALATSVPDSGGVIVVPAFAGLGAPHWRPDARALIAGITRGTTKAHLARATLEGIALQNVDILRAMERDAGRSLGTLKDDRGSVLYYVTAASGLRNLVRTG